MPIKPGSIIETTITRIGLEGDGVGEYEGLHVIVPKTAIGDRVSCQVKYTTKDRIHADLGAVLEAGAGRVSPPCSYYEACGGCGLQHIDADGYKDYKLGLLTAALQNNDIPLPHEISWFSVGESSRRRAFVRFDKNPHPNPLPKGEGAYRLGFYEHQSHKVINIEQCLILEKELEDLLAPLKKISINLSVSVDIEGWMVTATDGGIDLALHSGDKKIKNESQIFSSLAAFAKANNIARILWKRGERIVPVITITKPVLNIGGRDLPLPGEYFLQASKAGQVAILDAVTASVDEGANMLDLFSGLGIYSFALADKAKRVAAYEIAAEMVEAMEGNIRAHNLGDKISAYCRDIETYPLGRD